VDSSSIVGIAAHLRAVASGGVGADRTHTERDASPQLAFFAEFREGGIDERPYVDAVVAATGITLHTTTPDDNLFLASLDDVIEAQDEPFGSLSVLAQFHVMRIARAAGVKVLLDGQGADELLAGYLNYVGIRFAGGLRQRDPLTLLGAGRAAIVGRGPFLSTLGYALLGSRRLPARLVRGRMPTEWIGPATRGMEPSPRPPAPGPGTLLARKLWSDVASDNLPGLLRYEDRNSMAFGIEARVPFLDHRLVEASFALPDRLKIPTRSRRKAVLHEAMRGIVPDVVLGRRDKVAFQPPERRWLVAAEPRWRLLASSSVAEREQLISPGTISGSLDAFKAGKVRGSVLWRVLNLELWLRGLESPRIGGP
jgi:asparagine synthase (glutamine-hydrolysing)